jgi:hypothetical protein
MRAAGAREGGTRLAGPEPQTPGDPIAVFAGARARSSRPAASRVARRLGVNQLVGERSGQRDLVADLVIAFAVGSPKHRRYPQHL